MLSGPDGTREDLSEDPSAGLVGGETGTSALRPRVLTAALPLCSANLSPGRTVLEMLWDPVV